MESIAVEYFRTSVDIGNNEEKYEFHSYISDDSEQDTCDSNAHMVHLLKLFYNQEDYFLVCKKYGKTLMVLQINIGVLFLYI